MRSDASLRQLKDALRTASHAANWLNLGGYGRHVPLVIAISSDLSPRLIKQADRMGLPEQRLNNLSSKDVDEILDITRRFFVLGDPRN